MKALFVASLFAAACVSISADATPTLEQLHTYTFEQFEQDFGRVYASSEERSMRQEIFNSKLKEALDHNVGGHSYKKGINLFSDRTMDEVAAVSSGTLHSDQTNLREPKRVPSVALPKTVDYRNTRPSVLTGVKSQGNCGSCWAHAAIESIESHYAIKTGQLFDLSQQQLVSCMKNPNKCGGNGGCFGATIDLAYKYAIANGSPSEWTYPYESYFGESPPCSSNPLAHKPVVKPTGYVMVNPNDQVAVMEALATQGPLAVVVDASFWSSYQSGIFSGCSYKKNITINHGVQLVGYGSDPALGQDYWIIRNSWSPKWGENGYIRLAREPVAQCGWSVQWKTQGLGCKTDPDEVWSCGQCGVLKETSYPTFA